MRRVIILVVLGTFLSSCGARKKTNRNQETEVNVNIPSIATPDAPSIILTPTYNSTEDYIAFFKAVAIHEMKLYGIPASITLAQGILESGSGKGRLARQANNHFGIKCHDWTGPRIYHDDDRAQECFRKYNDPSQSYRDHSLFLAKRKRYADLFKHKITDYKAWARGLKKAGYATDPQYPKKLISLIERYKLYRYDIFDKKKKNKKERGRTFQTHRVQKGDTLYSIAKRYNTTVEYIKSSNNLNSNALDIGQTLVIRSN
ncbi:N-acetylmuramidase [Formosa sp. Hel3_A1_48]|jgi:flagellum-specific peptidoglycan hydrolase FlgJ|uniref:glucosaminidase domain-containing protein n=1 Tax=Formosa sp. Hel3_A1_48 TaxID=1336795 RepID=UPI00084E232F|nr:glucosaminidase domain-containing protein [Formosa sp. Hel3_A1_48]AOR25581.1 N-acetylmuramidase [Formosa sp. Hel3_A1_48]MDC0950426.1 glucosaminidase domain-containing protein [Flavobacteriaceae bacterium]